MSWIYIQSKPQLWTVGHYDPDGKFNPESDHRSPDEAAKRVRWLNGGRDEPPGRVPTRNPFESTRTPDPDDDDYDPRG